jgi:hypothetical protein
MRQNAARVRDHVQQSGHFYVFARARLPASINYIAHTVHSAWFNT